jgi:alkylated DNA repair dioxygenase AlkB
LVERRPYKTLVAGSIPAAPTIFNINKKGVAMKANVNYTAGFVNDPTEAFNSLWNELDWERRGSTPRREYYCNEVAVPYVYGSGLGVREYLPKAWHPTILSIKKSAEEALGVKFEVCFLNGYEDSRDHLGWHSDNSPEMDDARPIAIVTLGAEREIWFRSLSSDDAEVTKVLLESGSLCVMPPGMQDTHAHRIPKAGFECGARISLTFRGYAKDPA